MEEEEEEKEEEEEGSGHCAAAKAPGERRVKGSPHPEGQRGRRVLLPLSPVLSDKDGARQR